MKCASGTGTATHVTVSELSFKDWKCRA